MESTQDPRTWIPQPIYGHKGSKRMKLVGFLDIVPIFLKATSSYSIIFPPEIEKIDVLDSPSPLDLSRFTQLYPDFLMNPPVEIPISPDPNQGPWGPLGAPWGPRLQAFLQGSSDSSRPELLQWPWRISPRSCGTGDTTGATKDLKLYKVTALTIPCCLQAFLGSETFGAMKIN